MKNDLQVLVTTMHSTDLSLVKKMNIKGSVLIANQANCYDYTRLDRDSATVEMVTTPTRGASKNRNIAIECSSLNVKYLMFSDDDLVFNDDYEAVVLEEFARHPEADAIKFNLFDISKSRKLSMKRIDVFKKATRRNVAASGVWAMAIKRDVLLKKNLRFNEFFGPGTENYCGEDTIFLQNMIQKKVRLYLSPIEIAGIDQSQSSWFEGYNERYFRSSGSTFAAVYPKLAKLITIRSAYRFTRRKNCNMKFKDILSCYWQGIDSYLKK